MNKHLQIGFVLIVIPMVMVIISWEGAKLLPESMRDTFLLVMAIIIALVFFLNLIKISEKYVSEEGKGK